MVGGLPILLAIAAGTFGHERLARWEWGALTLSTAGAGLIALGGRTAARGGPTLVGDGLVLVSLLAAVAWLLLSKRLTRHYPPSAVSIATIWAGTVLLTLWVVGRHGTPSADLSAGTWVALAAQGVLATMAATLCWNWGVARVPAGRAGVFANLEPIVGTALGVLVLGEALDSVALAGGLLIVGAATAIAVRDTTRPRAGPST